MFSLHCVVEERLESFLGVFISVTANFCHHRKHFKCPLVMSGCLAYDISNYQCFGSSPKSQSCFYHSINPEDILT